VKLYDSSNHLTHFTGFMLEEEIVAFLWVLLNRNAQNDHRLTIDTEMDTLIGLNIQGEWKDIHLNPIHLRDGNFSIKCLM
jgi:hypothetical protein